MRIGRANNRGCNVHITFFPLRQNLQKDFLVCPKNPVTCALKAVGQKIEPDPLKADLEANSKCTNLQLPLF